MPNAIDLFNEEEMGCSFKNRNDSLLIKWQISKDQENGDFLIILDIEIG